eukprot:21389-Heterococcus_DN1.PRE.1
MRQHSFSVQCATGLGKTSTAATLVMSTKGRRPAPLSITVLTEQERSAAVDERWQQAADFYKKRFMSSAVHDKLMTQQR